ncbi:hypothetical protein BDC45DRAFT_539939 [Circinella umbellata]|nr:hypothetical protein BDC45DRAFT_539939 [Circinella umbellata]
MNEAEMKSMLYLTRVAINKKQQESWNLSLVPTENSVAHMQDEENIEEAVIQSFIQPLKVLYGRHKCQWYVEDVTVQQSALFNGPIQHAYHLVTSLSTEHWGEYGSTRPGIHANNKHFKDSDQEYISLNEVYDYVRNYFELYFEHNKSCHSIRTETDSKDIAATSILEPQDLKYTALLLLGHKNYMIFVYEEGKMKYP